MLVRRCLDYNIDQTYDGESDQVVLRISSGPIAYRDEEGELSPINLAFKEDEDSFYCKENNLKLYVYKECSGEDLRVESEDGLDVSIEFLDLRIREDSSIDMGYQDGGDSSIISSTRDKFEILIKRNRKNSYLLDEYLLVPSGYKHSLYIEEGFKDIVPRGNTLEIPYRYTFNKAVKVETWSGERRGVFETPSEVSFKALDNEEEKIEIQEPVFFDINREGNLPVWYKVEIISPSEIVFSYVVETDSFFLDTLKYPLIIDPVRRIARTTWKQTTDESYDFGFFSDQEVYVWLGARGYDTVYSSTTARASLWDGSANGSFTSSNRRISVSSTSQKNENTWGGWIVLQGNNTKSSRIEAWQSNRQGVGNSALVEAEIVYNTSYLRNPALDSDKVLFYRFMLDKLRVFQEDSTWSTYTSPVLYFYDGTGWRRRYMYYSDAVQPFIDD